MLPFEPTEFLAELAAHKAAHPDFAVERGALLPARRHHRDHRLRRRRDRAGAPARGHEPASALLFDLDGTLVDTDHLHHAAFAAILAERGARR